MGTVPDSRSGADADADPRSGSVPDSRSVPDSGSGSDFDPDPATGSLRLEIPTRCSLTPIAVASSLATMATPTLSIRVLGPLEVVGDGVALELPPSRKARGLLAYLVAEPRSHRRERLCELFWRQPDDPHDPRGALRWALSRVRKVLNRDGTERLVADRDEVGFVSKGTDVDYHEVKRACSREIDSAEAPTLIERFRGSFVDGLDLPDCMEFSSWRAGLRDECTKYLEKLLVAALAGDVDRAIKVRYARRLVELRPLDAEAHGTLIRLLAAEGRTTEAEERFGAAKQLLGSHPTYPVVTEAWRVARKQTVPDDLALVTDPSSRPAAHSSKPPAVAVLPLNNMSGDPEQEHFADGISEDIITDLARARLFPVIARNSSFALKGRAFDIRSVARELSADYLVEGSVRCTHNRVRVTVQLIDASNGQHVWASRYDRPLGDIFSVQDDIAQRVCGALRPELIGAEQQRLSRVAPRSLEAWEELLLGMQHYRRTTAHDLEKARDHCERALLLDPSLAEAHARIAGAEAWKVILDLTDHPKDALSQAFKHAVQACALDPDNALAHSVLTWVHFFGGEPDQALVEARLAVDLNPSDALARGSLASLLLSMGELEQARSEVDRAIALSPRDPMSHLLFSVESMTSYLEEGYEDGIRWASACIRSNPDFPWGYFDKAACLAQLGRLEEARQAFADGCIARPDPDLVFFTSSWAFRVKEHMDHVLDGMRKSGWDG